MEAPFGSLSLPMARSSSPSPLWFPALQDEYFYVSNSPSSSSSSSSQMMDPMLSSSAHMSAHQHPFGRSASNATRRHKSPLERSTENILEMPFDRDVVSHLGLSRVKSHDTIGAASIRTVASAETADRGRKPLRRCSHRAMSAQDFESIIKQVYSDEDMGATLKR